MKSRLSQIENRKKPMDRKDDSKPTLRRTTTSMDSQQKGGQKSDDDRPTLTRRIADIRFLTMGKPATNQALRGKLTLQYA